jgi:predicted RNase H-like HicB family nuclease
MSEYKYKMILQWSNEDNCFLVGLPDFEGQTWRTHGKTYSEAVINGEGVIESLVSSYELLKQSPPKPSYTDDEKNIK